MLKSGMEFILFRFLYMYGDLLSKKLCNFADCFK